LVRGDINDPNAFSWTEEEEIKLRDIDTLVHEEWDFIFKRYKADEQ